MKTKSLKQISVLLFISIFILTGNLLSVDEAKAEKVYNLKLGSLMPQAELYRLQHFVDNVERMSGGRIKFQVFSSGQIAPDEEMLNACSAGVVDIANGIGLNFMNRIPVAGVEAGLPFAYRKTHVDHGVLFDGRGFIELVREEYKKKGNVHYIGYVGADPTHLLTAKPVKSLAELKKMKIRAAGQIANMLKVAGVRTTYIPPEELYVALSSGTIDGIVFGGPAAYYDMKLFEVGKYMYDPPFNAGYALNMVANPRVWDSLPDDLKAILEVATKEYSLFLANSYLSDGIVKLAKAKSEFGVQVLTLPASDVQELAKAADKVWDEYAQKGPGAKKAITMLKQYHKDAGYMD